MTHTPHVLDLVVIWLLRPIAIDHAPLIITSEDIGYIIPLILMPCLHRVVPVA
jgi:hypothetical protein